MATPSQIDEQIALEREAIRAGLASLEASTRKAEEGEYASSTDYGRASIKAIQGAVQDELLATFDKIKCRKNGPYHASIVRHLHAFNSEAGTAVLANIALKKLFDAVFCVKKKEQKGPPNTVINVCQKVGKAIEAECQLRWYEEVNPDYLNHIKKNYWKSTTGTRQKQTVASIMMNRKEHHWERWSDAAVRDIGAWLIHAVMTCSGWFEKVVVGVGSKKKELVVPTDAYLAIQEDLQKQAELYSPYAWPMIIEPNDWTNEKAGGYLLNEVMRGHELVRNGNCAIIQAKEPLDFLNKLQKVGYRLNDYVYDVAKELDRLGRKVGKFKPLSYAANLPEPVAPPIMEGELFEEWKRKREEYETAKKKYLRSDHVRTTATMDLCKRFQGKVFYLPWSFDYRGRVYPIPPFLTIQDTDFGKSLLKFADESFMTPEAEEWLAFHVATQYGLDKKPIAERIAWTQANHELITRIVKDPIGCLPEWESADEPWQFLSACEEYYHVCIACDRHFTGFMIASDATCSGLQILAGLAQDAKTAELVNVTPGPKPADAYMAVRDKMIEHVPDKLKPFFDRSCVKRSVMTIPYNATKMSSKEYIYKALKDNITEDTTLSKKECMELAIALRDAMDVVAPGPLRVMDWLAKEIGLAIRNGKEFIQWTAPSGFVVYQRRDNYSSKRQRLHLMGVCQVRVQGDSTGPNINKHKSSGAPNLIHSIDASLLCLTFNRFDGPFSVIHDSILCRATDMGSLSRLIRESYYEVFSGESFLLDFKRQIGAQSDPPIVGDLDAEEVLNSTYFFS